MAKKSIVQRIGDSFEDRMRRFNVILRGLSLSPEEVVALKMRMEREISMTMKLIDETSAFRGGSGATDGLEGASREELLSQLRRCRLAAMTLAHQLAEVQKESSARTP